MNPDLVWIHRERLAVMLDGEGHLRAAPDLVVEVLSSRPEIKRRDREAKLRLYSRYGVRGYWIAGWQMRQVSVYRRQDLALALVATLRGGDVLTSPLLPRFELPLDRVFADVPAPGS